MTGRERWARWLGCLVQGALMALVLVALTVLLVSAGMADTRYGW